MKENNTTSQTININDKAAFKAEWDKSIQAGIELKKSLEKNKEEEVSKAFLEQVRLRRIRRSW